MISPPKRRDCPRELSFMIGIIMKVIVMGILKIGCISILLGRSSGHMRGR